MDASELQADKGEGSASDEVKSWDATFLPSAELFFLLVDGLVIVSIFI